MNENYVENLEQNRKWDDLTPEEQQQYLETFDEKPQNRSRASSSASRVSTESRNSIKTLKEGEYDNESMIYANKMNNMSGNNLRHSMADSEISQ